MTQREFDTEDGRPENTDNIAIFLSGKGFYDEVTTITNPDGTVETKTIRHFVEPGSPIPEDYEPQSFKV